VSAPNMRGIIRRAARETSRVTIVPLVRKRHAELRKLQPPADVSDKLSDVFRELPMRRRILDHVWHHLCRSRKGPQPRVDHNRGDPGLHANYFLAGNPNIADREHGDACHLPCSTDGSR